MADLPTGTVTLLFTDIEGCTRLWEAHAEAMRAALARHDALLPSIGISPVADMDAHQTIVTAALAAKSSAETPRNVTTTS